jgi:hypothetical protein
VVVGGGWSGCPWAFLRDPPCCLPGRIEPSRASDVVGASDSASSLSSVLVSVLDWRAAHVSAPMAAANRSGMFPRQPRGRWPSARARALPPFATAPSTPPAGPRPPPPLAHGKGSEAEERTGRNGDVRDVSGTSAMCPEQTVRHESGIHNRASGATVTALSQNCHCLRARFRRG